MSRCMPRNEADLAVSEDIIYIAEREIKEPG
jgi:hypothetical protein